MLKTLTAAVLIAVAATGCQNELALFPHASADTAVTEDSPAWNCVLDGNRVCGPNNVQHTAPGCYSDTGALVDPWPCHVIVNADGSSDVYGGL